MNGPTLLLAMSLAFAAQELVAQAPDASREPYPLRGAGWGPAAPRGRLVTRWAEDWSGAQRSGVAPAGKAVPLGAVGQLSVSAETRLRYQRSDNTRLRDGEDYDQLLWRGVFGADLRLDDHWRAYAELASGQLRGGPSPSPANQHDDVALAQALVELRGDIGGVHCGALAGRQEFADGPRQLISVSDGPNLHRTWNGVRLFGHGERVRAGAFAFVATRLDRGTPLGDLDAREQLAGANLGAVLAPPSPRGEAFVDLFWFHSRLPSVALGDDLADERRETIGLRGWGRVERYAYDGTLVHQVGRHGERDVRAWGVFALQSLLLAEVDWQPRATLQVDVASGGGGGSGTTNTFHALYASSNHLGQGRLLALANLALVSPGVEVAPTRTTRLSCQLGFARRLAAEDAVYGGGMRAYSHTGGHDGSDVGRLLRVTGQWQAPGGAEVTIGFERLFAGDLLERAGAASGSFLFTSITFRF